MQMDKDKILDEIFSNDPFGLLNVKPSSAPARTADERLVASFQALNDFYEANKREPQLGGGVQEHMLYSRLKSIREDSIKSESLKPYDTHGLLNYVKKEFNSLDDILNDDSLDLLKSEDEGLFEFKHVKSFKDREATDFVARRKPCKDFNKYEAQLKEVQADLKSGKRTIVEFKQQNLRQGAYYVHNGILFLIEKINITKKEHYKPDGTRVREDGRTRCIFENGTESNMLKRSVEKLLYDNGWVVSENADKVNEEIIEKLQEITEEDKEAGYIYILKSKSTHSEIQNINNLYKIGYSEIEVEQRIKNAEKEPTYLMAAVEVVSIFKCYNMNPQKLEKMLHNFFGNSCLNIDVTDNNGQRHTPREWFIAPLNVITETIHLIINGEILKYRFDSDSKEIVLK
jgi:hypothetical protein